MNASGADVSYSEIISDKGHDSFFNEPEFLKTLKSFIESMYDKFKNEKEFKVTVELPNNSKVLDVEGGDGSLMNFLEKENIIVRGLELNQDNVQQCIHKGLSVIQGNAETNSPPNQSLIT